MTERIKWSNKGSSVVVGLQNAEIINKTNVIHEALALYVHE